MKGQWACKPAPPLCPGDASSGPETCPDPAKLVDGTPCTMAGLACKGNPTSCGGGLFYDALQCDGTKFVTLAATVCGIDGGAG
jgi:hypothetical protein